MEDIRENYLPSMISLFEYYKNLGEKAIAQLDETQLSVQLDEESNSIGSIVKHLWGNMLSRFTDFLTTDGEKEWRQREAEFDNDLVTREEIMEKWNAGWTCFLDTLRGLTPEDLDKIIYIRNQGHTVIEAITRQLAHYSYHVGQIVFLSKHLARNPWQSLSIPRGGTKAFNNEKFAKEKEVRFFANDGNK